MAPLTFMFDVFQAMRPQGSARHDGELRSAMGLPSRSFQAELPVHDEDDVMLYGSGVIPRASQVIDLCGPFSISSKQMLAAQPAASRSTRPLPEDTQQYVLKEEIGSLRQKLEQSFKVQDDKQREIRNLKRELEAAQAPASKPATSTRVPVDGADSLSAIEELEALAAAKSAQIAELASQQAEHESEMRRARQEILAKVEQVNKANAVIQQLAQDNESMQAQLDLEVQKGIRNDSERAALEAELARAKKAARLAQEQRDAAQLEVGDSQVH
jgi:chromosome segregation ATPase